MSKAPERYSASYGIKAFFPQDPRKSDDILFDLSAWDCYDCGGVVFDPQAHDKSHREINNPHSQSTG